MNDGSARESLNGVDAKALRRRAAEAAANHASADRDPQVVARWLGGDRAEIAFASGEPALIVGGSSPSAMKLLLASLAACDVDLVVTRATLLGVEIDSLVVEATGHFNVSGYLGVEPADDPGYERIGYRVRVRAGNATTAQMAALRRACEEASPVGGSLKRQVHLALEFDGA